MIPVLPSFFRSDLRNLNQAQLYRRENPVMKAVKVIILLSERSGPKAGIPSPKVRISTPELRVNVPKTILIMGLAERCKPVPKIKPSGPVQSTRIGASDGWTIKVSQADTNATSIPPRGLINAATATGSVPRALRTWPGPGIRPGAICIRAVREASREKRVKSRTAKVCFPDI